jgi:hypothetical protein
MGFPVQRPLFTAPDICSHNACGETCESAQQGACCGSSPADRGAFVDSVDRCPGFVSRVRASQITSGNGAVFRSRDDLDWVPIASPNRGRSLATSVGDLSVSPDHADQRILIPIGRFIDGVAKIHSHMTFMAQVL